MTLIFWHFNVMNPKDYYFLQQHVLGQFHAGSILQFLRVFFVDQNCSSISVTLKGPIRKKISWYIVLVETSSGTPQLPLK